MFFFWLFSDQNNKRIVLALQSGLKSEILWALNALAVLSFKEKDDFRRDTTPLAKVPGLLDALLQVVCPEFPFHLSGLIHLLLNHAIYILFEIV
jgi:hypothetical protein